MGLSAKARSTAGTVRAFPTLGRRVFHAEQKLDTLHEQAAIVELGRRVAALEQHRSPDHARDRHCGPLTGRRVVDRSHRADEPHVGPTDRTQRLLHRRQHLNTRNVQPSAANPSITGQLRPLDGPARPCRRIRSVRIEPLSR